MHFDKKYQRIIGEDFSYNHTIKIVKQALTDKKTMAIPILE